MRFKQTKNNYKILPNIGENQIDLELELSAMIDNNYLGERKEIGEKKYQEKKNEQIKAIRNGEYKIEIFEGNSPKDSFIEFKIDEKTYILWKEVINMKGIMMSNRKFVSYCIMWFLIGAIFTLIATGVLKWDYFKPKISMGMK